MNLTNSTKFVFPLVSCSIDANIIPARMLPRLTSLLRCTCSHSRSVPSSSRRAYAAAAPSTPPVDKLVTAAQKLIRTAEEEDDGGIEAAKRKRELEELSRALGEVQEGEEVSSEFLHFLFSCRGIRSRGDLQTPTKRLYQFIQVSKLTQYAPHPARLSPQVLLLRIDRARPRPPRPCALRPPRRRNKSPRTPFPPPPSPSSSRANLIPLRHPGSKVRRRGVRILPLRGGASAHVHQACCAQRVEGCPC